MSSPNPTYNDEICYTNYYGRRLFYETTEVISLETAYFSDLKTRTAHYYVDVKGLKYNKLLDEGETELGNVRFKYNKPRNAIIVTTKHPCHDNPILF